MTTAPDPKKQATKWDPTDFRRAVSTEAARIEEDATYASKSHFNAAAAWDHRHLALGALTAFVGAASGTTGLLANRPIVAALLAFLAAAGTAVLTAQKPGERASAHRKAAVGYAEVRERARRLREIDALGPSAEKDLRAELEGIAREKQRVAKDAPVPSDAAYQRAKVGIESIGEARHAIDSRTSEKGDG